MSNVIIRNMKISKVLADAGDAIAIQASSNVWVDHCDLSSDMDHDKDYYDGLCDVTHAANYVTISNTYFHVRRPHLTNSLPEKKNISHCAHIWLTLNFLLVGPLEGVPGWTQRQQR